MFFPFKYDIIPLVFERRSGSRVFLCAKSNGRVGCCASSADWTGIFQRTKNLRYATIAQRSVIPTQAGLTLYKVQGLDCFEHRRLHRRISAGQVRNCAGPRAYWSFAVLQPYSAATSKKALFKGCRFGAMPPKTKNRLSS